MSALFQNTFIAAEKRPQQLAAGKASHSAAAGLLSGVYGFPKYKTRWDFATTGYKKGQACLRLRSLLKMYFTSDIFREVDVGQLRS